MMGLAAASSTRKGLPQLLIYKSAESKLLVQVNVYMLSNNDSVVYRILKCTLNTYSADMSLVDMRRLTAQHPNLYIISALTKKG
jgi:hypothetical protein